MPPSLRLALLGLLLVPALCLPPFIRGPPAPSVLDQLPDDGDDSDILYSVGDAYSVERLPPVVSAHAQYTPLEISHDLSWEEPVTRRRLMDLLRRLHAASRPQLHFRPLREPVMPLPAPVWEDDLMYPYPQLEKPLAGDHPENQHHALLPHFTEPSKFNIPTHPPVKKTTPKPYVPHYTISHHSTYYGLNPDKYWPNGYRRTTVPQRFHLSTEKSMPVTKPTVEVIPQTSSSPHYTLSNVYIRYSPEVTTSEYNKKHTTINSSEKPFIQSSVTSTYPKYSFPVEKYGHRPNVFHTDITHITDNDKEMYPTTASVPFLATVNYNINSGTSDSEHWYEETYSGGPTRQPLVESESSGHVTESHLQNSNGFQKIPSVISIFPIKDAISLTDETNNNSDESLGNTWPTSQSHHHQDITVHSQATHEDSITATDEGFDDFHLLSTPELVDIITDIVESINHDSLPDKTSDPNEPENNLVHSDEPVAHSSEKHIYNVSQLEGASTSETSVVDETENSYLIPILNLDSTGAELTGLEPVFSEDTTSDTGNVAFIQQSEVVGPTVEADTTEQTTFSASDIILELDSLTTEPNDFHTTDNLLIERLSTTEDYTPTYNSENSFYSTTEHNILPPSLFSENTSSNPIAESIENFSNTPMTPAQTSSTESDKIYAHRTVQKEINLVSSSVNTADSDNTDTGNTGLIVLGTAESSYAMDDQDSVINKYTTSSSPSPTSSSGDRQKFNTEGQFGEVFSSVLGDNSVLDIVAASEDSLYNDESMDHLVTLEDSPHVEEQPPLPQGPVSPTKGNEDREEEHLIHTEEHEIYKPSAETFQVDSKPSVYHPETYDHQLDNDSPWHVYHTDDGEIISELDEDHPYASHYDFGDQYAIHFGPDSKPETVDNEALLHTPGKQDDRILYTVELSTSRNFVPYKTTDPLVIMENPQTNTIALPTAPEVTIEEPTVNPINVGTELNVLTVMPQTTVNTNEESLFNDSEVSTEPTEDSATEISTPPTYELSSQEIVTTTDMLEETSTSTLQVQDGLITTNNEISESDLGSEDFVTLVTSTQLSENNAVTTAETELRDNEDSQLATSTVANVKSLDIFTASNEMVFSPVEETITPLPDNLVQSTVFPMSDNQDVTTETSTIVENLSILTNSNEIVLSATEESVAPVTDNLDSNVASVSDSQVISTETSTMINGILEGNYETTTIALQGNELRQTSVTDETATFNAISVTKETTTPDGSLMVTNMVSVSDLDYRVPSTTITQESLTLKPDLEDVISTASETEQISITSESENKEADFSAENSDQISLSIIPTAAPSYMNDDNVLFLKDNHTLTDEPESEFQSDISDKDMTKVQSTFGDFEIISSNFFSSQLPTSGSDVNGFLDHEEPVEFFDNIEHSEKSKIPTAPDLAEGENSEGNSEKSHIYVETSTKNVENETPSLSEVHVVEPPLQDKEYFQSVYKNVSNKDDNGVNSDSEDSKNEESPIWLDVENDENGGVDNYNSFHPWEEETDITPEALHLEQDQEQENVQKDEIGHYIDEVELHADDIFMEDAEVTPEALHSEQDQEQENVQKHEIWHDDDGEIDLHADNIFMEDTDITPEFSHSEQEQVNVEKDEIWHYEDDEAEDMHAENIFIEVTEPSPKPLHSAVTLLPNYIFDLSTEVVSHSFPVKSEETAKPAPDFTYGTTTTPDTLQISNAITPVYIELSSLFDNDVKDIDSTSKQYVITLGNEVIAAEQSFNKVPASTEDELTSSILDVTSTLSYNENPLIAVEITEQTPVEVITDASPLVDTLGTTMNVDETVANEQMLLIDAVATTLSNDETVVNSEVIAEDSTGEETTTSSENDQTISLDIPPITLSYDETAVNLEPITQDQTVEENTLPSQQEQTTSADGLTTTVTNVELLENFEEVSESQSLSQDLASVGNEQVLFVDIPATTATNDVVVDTTEMQTVFESALPADNEQLLSVATMISNEVTVGNAFLEEASTSAVNDQTLSADALSATLTNDITLNADVISEEQTFVEVTTSPYNEPTPAIDVPTTVGNGQTVDSAEVIGEIQTVDGVTESAGNEQDFSVAFFTSTLSNDETTVVGTQVAAQGPSVDAVTVTPLPNSDNLAETTVFQPLSILENIDLSTSNNLVYSQETTQVNEAGLTTGDLANEVEADTLWSALGLPVTTEVNEIVSGETTERNAADCGPNCDAAVTNSGNFDTESSETVEVTSIAHTTERDVLATSFQTDPSLALGETNEFSTSYPGYAAFQVQQSTLDNGINSSVENKEEADVSNNSHFLVLKTESLITSTDYPHTSTPFESRDNTNIHVTEPSRILNTKPADNTVYNPESLSDSNIVWLPIELNPQPGKFMTDVESIRKDQSSVDHMMPALTMLLHRFLSKDQPQKLESRSDAIERVLGLARSKFKDSGRNLGIPSNSSVSGSVPKVSGESYDGDEPVTAVPEAESNQEYIELTAEDLLLLIPILIDELKTGVLTAEEQEIFHGVFGDLWSVMVAEAAARRQREEQLATQQPEATPATEGRQRSARSAELVAAERRTAPELVDGGAAWHLQDITLFEEGARWVDTRPRGRPSSLPWHRHGLQRLSVDVEVPTEPPAD